jgi:hypothetical protein
VIEENFSPSTQRSRKETRSRDWNLGCFSLTAKQRWSTIEAPSTDRPDYEKNSSRLSRHSFRSSELRLFRRARPALNTARDDSPRDSASGNRSSGRGEGDDRRWCIQKHRDTRIDRSRWPAGKPDSPSHDPSQRDAGTTPPRRPVQGEERAPDCFCSTPCIRRRARQFVRLRANSIVGAQGIRRHMINVPPATPVPPNRRLPP